MKVIKVANPLEYHTGQEIDGEYVISIHRFDNAIIVGKPIYCLLCQNQMHLSIRRIEDTLSVIGVCTKCNIRYWEHNGWFAQTNCKYTQAELDRIVKLKAFL
jgi:hypothetical protein